MELLQYWRVIKKRLWVLALLVVVGMASTAFYTLQQPAEYQSTATLLLNPSVPGSFAPYVEAQVASNLADTYAEFMRSQSFAQSVVKELPFAMSAGQVAGSISTRVVPNTMFFKVTAQTDSAEHAQLLANTVVKVFLSTNAAQQAQTTQGADSLKNDMRTRLQDKLTYIGDQLKSYQDQIKTLQAQPASKDRDDQILQLRGQLLTVQQTETEAIVALGHIDDTSVPASTALVVDPALPGYRAPSKLVTNLFIAAVVSLVLGVVLAFLLNYLDYTVRSPEYLEQVLGLTAMAVVGMVGATGRNSYGYGYGQRRRRGRGGVSAPPVRPSEAPARLAGHNLVTLDTPRSPDSESFRVLRTNLQFSSLGKPIHSLVVTSGSPGEGKSFTAANLAIVMAQAGKRVILVDTDLRRPSLHKLFDLSNAVGFTNLVLNDSGDKGGAIQPVPEVPNLLIVPSGPLPPNPSELLDSNQTAQVMNYLAQCADLVIYDTPPATAVTDPAILAARVDAVVLVINAGMTRRDVVERVKKILAAVNVKVMIPVLNRVKLQDIHGYYYYYHSDSSFMDLPAEVINGAAASNGGGRRGRQKAATAARLNGNGHHANGSGPHANGKTPSATTVETLQPPPEEQ